MRRSCPHSDRMCEHGMDCPYTCATGSYDGKKRLAPIPQDHPMTDTRSPSALERAARAFIAKAIETSRTNYACYDDDLTNVEFEVVGSDFLAAMRAALEALREDVTEEMMIAGIIAYADAMRPAVEMLDKAREHTASQMLRALSGDDFRAVFHAMLTALLTEGQKEPGQ